MNEKEEIVKIKVTQNLLKFSMKNKRKKKWSFSFNFSDIVEKFYKFSQDFISKLDKIFDQ